MLKLFFIFCLTLLFEGIFAQQPHPALTVETIMQDPKWIGSSPSNPRWDVQGNRLYFNWNPTAAADDSLYYITITNRIPVKTAAGEKIIRYNDVVWNEAHNAYVYGDNGDIFYVTLQPSASLQITQTADAENNPGFGFLDRKIVYSANQNLYAWDIKTGQTIQLIQLKTGADVSSEKALPLNSQETWLTKDQLQYFEVLTERKEKRTATQAYNEATRPKPMRSIYTGTNNAIGLRLSPDGRFVSYRIFKRGTGKAIIIPNYVTETGFTTDINGRTKVGAPQGSTSLFFYDRLMDTVIEVKPGNLAGVKDIPSYFADYPLELAKKQKANEDRALNFSDPKWNASSSFALVEISSQDNKDRWIMIWDANARLLKQLDRQHNDAWIGGPGINSNATGWIDSVTLWYQSEATGYSHLYTQHIKTNKKTQLTSGTYEVQSAQLSLDKKYFFISTNAVHPGEQQFYKLRIADNFTERLTNGTGANLAALSPNEKELAILFSSATHPWELYLQPAKPNSVPTQITFKAETDAFKKMNWQAPEVVNFKATDGATVYARLYKPATAHPSKPAVIFVHGAGYLQNAHKWWSSYFREFMFNNLLAANGYYVMDVDYRASAGYGEKWRTGIYRHMGGLDLSDNIDAAKYLQNSHGVNASNIGLYGGSYGGFITLMGLFTAPEVFKAGAALRSVTDWANYNHGYTSNILNEPATDSIAYRRSSPLYFAEGLKGNLLMCHGMVDVNVHYQDIIKLTQRLIELKKDNWELASYPMEDHGFVTPSSWTDEYKRIFKLFEATLKK